MTTTTKNILKVRGFFYVFIYQMCKKIVSDGTRTMSEGIKEQEG
jgi:hypothetical protein